MAPSSPFPFVPVDAASPEVRVFVRDYETLAQIGLFDNERGRCQRIRLSIDSGCRYGDLSGCRSRQSVVCYKSIVDGIEQELAQGHIETVELLADRLCNRFFADKRILWLWVKIEKLEAIDQAGSVGVCLMRYRDQPEEDPGTASNTGSA